MFVGVECYLRFMVHGLGIPSYFAAFETGQGTYPAGVYFAGWTPMTPMSRFN